MSGRVWLITGAGSGFGKAMTEHVLSKGEVAIATDIRPEPLADLQSQYGEDKLFVRRMDVRELEEVREVFKEAFQKYGRIDIVFNNAGIAVIGELEGTPMRAGRNQFEVNFWGTLNVTTEAIKTFRDKNPPGEGGRLLITSSLVGIACSPAVGYYTAAKHATEGVTESFAAELDPEWNIKITILQPGMFRTSLNTFEPFPVHPAYTKRTLPSHIARRMISDVNIMPGDPEKAAKAIFKVSSLEDPPIRLALGRDAVDTVRKALQDMLASLEEYESWSEDLLFG